MLSPLIAGIVLNKVQPFGKVSELLTTICATIKSPTSQVIDELNVVPLDTSLQTTLSAVAVFGVIFTAPECKSEVLPDSNGVVNVLVFC